MKNIIRAILVTALLAVLAACGSGSGQSVGTAPSSSVEQSAPEQSPAETEASSADDNTIALPISAMGPEWLPGYLYWADNTRLIVTFHKPSDQGSTVAVLFDIVDQSTREIIAMDGYMGDIRANEQEILITTSEKIYTLSKPDFSFIEESENIGSAWGSNTFEGLSASRDDTGIVIKDRGGVAPDIRVATQSGDIFYDVPIWSPDGRYLHYNKYHGGVGLPIDLCIADRAGNTLWEFEVPELTYNELWSSNNRYILCVADQEYGGTTRLFDIAEGREIAAQTSPYVDCFYDIRDFYELSVFCWRENKAENNYTVCSFDAVSGETTDYITLDDACDIKVSPNGKLMAILEINNPDAIRIICVDA